jgi:hypothetical protein
LADEKCARNSYTSRDSRQCSLGHCPFTLLRAYETTQLHGLCKTLLCTCGAARGPRRARFWLVGVEARDEPGFGSFGVEARIPDEPGFGSFGVEASSAAHHGFEQGCAPPQTFVDRRRPRLRGIILTPQTDTQSLKPISYQPAPAGRLIIARHVAEARSTR